MALIGNNKRVSISSNNLNNVEFFDISIDEMTLKDDSHVAHFKKLGYKGCPEIKTRSSGKEFKLIKGQNLVDMNRWAEIKKLYFIFVRLERSKRTKINIFNAIVLLIQCCDHNGISDLFSDAAIVSFVTELKKRYSKGVKGKTLSMIQNSVKVILAEVNPDSFESIKLNFVEFPNDTCPSLSYTDDELKIIVSSLYKIFNAYRKCVLTNSIPSVHPLYDELTLRKNNSFTNASEGAWRKKLYSKNSEDTWRNDLIKTAFFLTCFYTGINESGLRNLRVSDISVDPFTQISSGSFILKTVKDRQGGKTNFVEVGFSKKAKEFFETWLLIRKIITVDCDFVFPYIVKNKLTKMKPAAAAGTLNNSFSMLGIPLLSTKKFRKTKATLIMRATESIFSVAEGLNNSPRSVSRHYTNGVPETMEFSIAAALDVRQMTAHGEELSIAIIESSYNYSDPVREQFYKQRKQTVPSKLSNGLRCKSSFGDKAHKLKDSLVKVGLAKEDNIVACHKFLECFGCPHHAVIAEVEDIWLMLSFRDVILEVSCQPSINTIPTNTLTKVLYTVESILERVKSCFSYEYNLAMSKYYDAPHPLWSDKTDFNFFVELY